MVYPLGLVNTKQQEFFFVSSFVLLSLYVAGLTVFLYFAFCLSLYAYAYAASVNQA